MEEAIHGVLSTASLRGRIRVVHVRRDSSGETGTDVHVGGQLDHLQERTRVGAAALLRDGTPLVFGPSAESGRLKHQIALAARTDSKVLLQGETGTGKSVVAREIHLRSGRSAQPFVHVDCAALSPSLIESELFGHERGAFTGAIASRVGRFEIARSGTIFLDEIGEVGPSVQGKLLRVLDDLTYERVGSSRPIPMRARVIAASRRDLRAAVQSGSFREDLFFRLNVLCIEISPLRRRLQDLPALAGATLVRLSQELGVKPPETTEGFLRCLAAYPWPGNIRELVNVLERLLVEGKTALDEDDVEPLLAVGAPTTPPTHADEAASISAALVEAGGVVARTARRLGMPRSSLRYKIKRYGLEHLIPRD